MRSTYRGKILAKQDTYVRSKLTRLQTFYIFK